MFSLASLVLLIASFSRVHAAVTSTSVATSSTSTTGLDPALNGLPSCAVYCSVLELNINTYGCASTDAKCLCDSAGFATANANCVKLYCYGTDYTSASKILDSYCISAGATAAAYYTSTAVVSVSSAPGASVSVSSAPGASVSVSSAPGASIPSLTSIDGYSFQTSLSTIMVGTSAIVVTVPVLVSAAQSTVFATSVAGGGSNGNSPASTIGGLSASQTPSSSSPQSDVSNAAKIGIGVGVGVVVLLAVALVVLFLLYRRRGRRLAATNQPPAPVAPAAQPPPQPNYPNYTTGQAYKPELDNSGRVLNNKAPALVTTQNQPAQFGTTYPNHYVPVEQVPAYEVANDQRNMPVYEIPNQQGNMPAHEVTNQERNMPELHSQGAVGYPQAPSHPRVELS